MTATCAITSLTEPVTVANQTAVTVAGTCTALNTVSVIIEDALGATVGPVSGTVVGTDWSIAATNVTALADGALVFKATSSDGSAAAFDAAAATKTTGLPLYITSTVFRESITDPSSLNANKVARAIQWASRRVDEICARTFGVATTATARVFIPESPRCARVDDISSVTDLVVKIDTGDDGTYDTTWTQGTDFTLGPPNQLNGGLPWPYTTVRAVGDTYFPASYRFESLQVTARWGWPSVPDAVVAATTLLAVRYYSRPDAPFGWSGSFDSSVPVRRDYDVEELLDDYAKKSRLTVG